MIRIIANKVTFCFHVLSIVRYVISYCHYNSNNDNNIQSEDTEAKRGQNETKTWVRKQDIWHK